MKTIRNVILFLLLAVFCQPASAQPLASSQIVLGWYEMVLRLVRHTPTYSPPVASRAFAYLGVTVFESVAAGSPDLQTLAGQLNGLQALPKRQAGMAYDEAAVLQSALAFSAGNFFANTGPTGQRAMAGIEQQLRAAAALGKPLDVVARSEAYGQSIARHIIAWSQDDGGAVVANMGFPLQYKLKAGPAHWVPTSTIAQQQMPLLPDWGNNRAFAMPDGASCALPPPPSYSEAKASQFYREAFETWQARIKLDPEQTAIARFWSDDPMLSPTPPGHWISIALQILERDAVDLERSAELLSRLGIAVADGFIGCWNAKFEYDLVRPVTYIRRMIDPKWEPLLITPPFPEYPSGHSTQSGAAAMVLTQFFGDNFAFRDATHQRDGLAPREFASFWEAAQEAGISRLYGGIHFRAAIDRGLDQGRCIGTYANALRTRS